MIDEEWLNALRFETIDGGKVIGLFGCGAEWVVFEHEFPDGHKTALKVKRATLGFHINEIPPNISSIPQYSVERLNKKLFRLIGNAAIDEWAFWLNMLNSKIIMLLKKNGIANFINGSLSDVELACFALRSSGIVRRLDDMSSIAPDRSNPIIRINAGTPSYSFPGSRVGIAKWATDVSAAIGRLKAGSQSAATSRIHSQFWGRLSNLIRANTQPDDASIKESIYSPERIHFNPLYMWCAAVMDGFYTREEMKEAVAFLRSKCADWGEHEQSRLIHGQMTSMACLMAQLLEDEDAPVWRMVEFCSLAGFSLRVKDVSGDIAYDGDDFRGS